MTLVATAAELRATAVDDEPPVEAPRRGRPRKHPPGTKPKPQRSGPQLKVQAQRPTIDRWRAAAKLAGMRLSPWIARAATAAADAALGPEAPRDEPSAAG